MKYRNLFAALAASLVVATQSLAAPVNINEADAETLAEALSGVGPAVSKRIVSYRKDNGPFAKPEDLMNVDGIGQKTFDRNKDDILVDSKPLQE